ncbi:MAG TPA: RnfABCDGE type electron transport complex subunit G [Candidatus Omnitrophota bacterium]|mgnify:CR=1 FL=1|nr:RnfABCDGE type electron transport complex subunit G [Candidatus Omnitrophota bacterium]
MKEALKFGLILAAICVAAGGLLTVVNRVTGPLIQTRLDEEKNDSLKEVFPQAQSFEPVQDGDTFLYYRAYDKDKKSIGVAFIASAKGYSSVIETMVGMAQDGTINAIKILQQNETPGLGARVQEVQTDLTLLGALAGQRSAGSSKPWFQEQFSGKRVDDLGEVDVITGATISSTAVIDSVKEKAEEISRLLKEKTP